MNYEIELPNGEKYETEDYDEYTKKLQEMGILVKDIEAPLCLNCNMPLNDIQIQNVWYDGESIIEEDVYKWAPGLQQYIVDPGILSSVESGLTTLRIYCHICKTPVEDLHPVPHSRSSRHGLIYGAKTRMAETL